MGGPNFFPTAAQVAAAVVAAARVVGDDPRQVFLERGARTRAVTAAAVKAAFPQLTWQEVGRLFGSGESLGDVVRIHRRKAQWWAKQGEAAVSAAVAAMGGGAPAVVPPPAHGEAVAGGGGPRPAEGVVEGADRAEADGVEPCREVHTIRLAVKLKTPVRNAPANHEPAVGSTAPSTIGSAADGPPPPGSPLASPGGGTDVGGLAPVPAPDLSSASPRCVDRPDSEITARMRQPAEFLGEPASTSRAGGEASSDGRPVGSGESGQAGLSLDDLILAALEPGPTHIGGLRRRLDNAFDQPEVLAALKRMADRKLVRCVGAVPASAQWRLIDGPGMLDDFRPRLTGGIVGRMAAAQMPAAAPMSSPSCRSGSRTVGRPAEMTKADPVSVLKLDGPGLAEVQALVSDGLPWRYISDRTGKSEHCLRMAFDRDYRARCQP